MATPQTITLSIVAGHALPDICFDLRGCNNFSEYLNGIFGDAAYPEVHPDHLNVTFDLVATQTCINAIYSDALTDTLMGSDITDVAAYAYLRTDKHRKPSLAVGKVTLTTTDPMNEDAALDAFTRSIDVDAATLAIERELTTLAHGPLAASCKAVVDIKPKARPWHDLKTTDPDRFYEIAAAAFRHFGSKPWAKAWSEEHSEIENFLHWVMTNHPDVDTFIATVTAKAAAAATVPDGSPDGQTHTPQPTNKTTPQPTNTPTPMTKTTTTTPPTGYKVAPATDPANPEAIAAQFKSQFEKALSAVSPSGRKLADCTQIWSTTTRPNDMPGRIISCKVIENEQTWHTFVFDCKDRHRDSFTMDEGMKFDWLSVDAMIKAFTGQASVLDCVKDACKKRLTGQTPAPKAQTKTTTTPAPQPATVPEAPAEGNTPAPMPKAQTKTAPVAAPQTAAPAPHAEQQTTETPAVFKTYECASTPSYYYHLYGDGETAGLLSIIKSDGSVLQHAKEQTMASSVAIIKQFGMTEVSPIPDVVITALIKEGVIKTPMTAAPSTTTTSTTIPSTTDTSTTAPCSPSLTEASNAEDTAAAERAEQERIAKEQAAEEERKRKAAAEEAKRKADEAKRKAKEEAKRKAEEEEAKKRAEEEKQKIAKRNATMTIRHRDYDKIRIEVELQPLTRTGNYFWGDAGTGKTHMAKMLADDFGLKFHYQGVVQAIHDFKGMVDGHGRFHATAAYYAATQGGLLLLDEMDRYPEDALIWLNGLIANRYASFYVWDEELQCVSEQTITAHPDFRVIGTGNTNGEGPTPLYTAAVQLDASTLDRFNFTHVDYDERVELAIAEGDAELVEFIEAFRATVRDCRFNNLVTYRAVETIHVYMKDGRIDIKDILADRIVKGMSTENQRFVAHRLGDHVSTTRNKYAKAYCELANENYLSAASKVA